MMVKYLTYDYVAPTAANQRKNTTNQDAQQQIQNEMGTQYDRMNEQFKTYKVVTRPFTVYGKPERASGYCNLRFAPNEKATLARRIRQNEMLTVIGETSRWYQVQDPQTGIIGYISRNYVTTNPN